MILVSASFSPVCKVYRYCIAAKANSFQLLLELEINTDTSTYMYNEWLDHSTRIKEGKMISSAWLIITTYDHSFLMTRRAGDTEKITGPARILKTFI